MEAYIGKDAYDTVSIYEISKRYDSANNIYHFKTTLVARHIIESVSDEGRIEDVYYEFTAKNYLTRVVADACSCECLVDKIFGQQGNYLYIYKLNERA